jgi:dipeptidase D
VEKTDAAERVMSHEMMQKFLDWILSTPNGVQAMSSDLPGFVQTSNNLCYVGTRYDFLEWQGKVFIVMYNLMRSSKTEDFTPLLENMEAKALELGAEYIENEIGLAPWEYKEDSPLRDTMVAVYQDVHGEVPVVSGIHYESI